MTTKSKTAKFGQSYGLEYRGHYFYICKDYVDIAIPDWNGRYARGDYDIIVKSLVPSKTAIECEIQAKAWVDAKLDVAA